MKAAKIAAIVVGTAGAVYIAGSWFLSRPLAAVLTSPSGLTPGTEHRKAFLDALWRHATIVGEFTHPGDPRDAVMIHSTFASPGDPGKRATILFLHGKGGNATEWLPDAVRALTAGFNVLIPDLRGSPPSGGKFITYGFLEKEDLRLGIQMATAKFEINPHRIGVHSCSAGSLVALQFVADNPDVRALWLESPFGEPVQMARHYLHLVTGLPEWSLHLVTRWAMGRAQEKVERALHATGPASWRIVDPVAAARQIHCPVELVYGEKDELVLPNFVPVLAQALPAGSIVWAAPGAGHCHHANEAEIVDHEEYVKRWTNFFTSKLLP